jgi:hypothetical protein
LLDYKCGSTSDLSDLYPYISQWGQRSRSWSALYVT